MIEPLDEDAFRRAFGRFATGVTVVTCIHGGLDRAMTANAVASVSLDPPLILVCVDVESRFHEAITGTARWGLSVLTASGRPAARWLATKGRPLQGQLDIVAHHRGPRTGVALLDDALATFECATVAIHPAGDHSIIVGQVLGMALGDGDMPALTFYRGAFGSLR